ncbi:EI24 domain-containing protein [soil metagenome]
MNLQGVARSWGRAVVAQFHYRILLLSLLPFFVSLLLWGLAMWWGMQALIDFVQAYFVEHDGFKTAGELLSMTGMLAFKTVVVPLIAMWLLLPFMVATSLLAIGLMAMPVISRHVSRRHYPQLEQRKGGSMLGSLWHSLSSFVIFLLLWLLSLPLVLIPPVHFILQPMLWGWLTYRVMAYDALADHADAEERKSLTRLHRKPLLIIGTLTGILGAAPTLLWLGGAMSVVFFPFFAGLAIWLYVLIFIFTGLWFQYYCMAALQQYRAHADA